MFLPFLWTCIIPALVVAQSSNSGESYMQPFNKDSVPLATREQWCAAQLKACPTQACILEGARDNDCDPKELTWKCTCNDGTTPELVEYANTVIAFINDIRLAECADEAGSDIKKKQDCYLKVVTNFPGIARGDNSSSTESSQSSTASLTTSNAPSTTAETTGTATTSSSQSTSATAAPQATESSQPGSSAKVTSNAIFGLIVACGVGMLGGFMI